MSQSRSYLDGELERKLVLEKLRINKRLCPNSFRHLHTDPYTPLSFVSSAKIRFPWVTSSVLERDSFLEDRVQEELYSLEVNLLFLE